MSTPSKYYNATNTKQAEEKFGMKIEDLLNEEDDDDDFDDDEDLEDLIKSSGITKTEISSANIIKANKE